jgi:hypothetical protein
MNTNNARHFQHWVHKIQDGNIQWRDNVNIGYTRYRIKTNNRETLSTLGTQDTGWRQTIERNCQNWVHKIQDVVCFHPVSCVPNVDIVSPLFVFILYLVYPMLTVSLDCLSSSCILCTQCWQCLSIVCLHPVSCVPNVDSVSRLFIFILYLVYPMLTLSLHCMFPSCILCTQCWQCLALFVFILYLVYLMLTVSLDCLSSSCIFCTQCWQCLSNTVNIEHTRYRMKINTRETMSTLGTHDTGWR